jgi:hypothetical protein
MRAVAPAPALRPVAHVPAHTGGFGVDAIIDYPLGFFCRKLSGACLN